MGKRFITIDKEVHACYTCGRGNALMCKCMCVPPSKDSKEIDNWIPVPGTEYVGEDGTESYIVN